MDDLRSTLMRMLSGRTVDTSAQLQRALLARINQRPADDPLREILGAMLAGGQREAQKSQPDPQMLLRAARDALKVLQQRNSALAAALGGCAECWGTQADCPQCKGLGRPGWVTPDPAVFETWVSPAVRAMAQSTSDNQPDRGANDPSGDAHAIHQGATVS